MYVFSDKVRQILHITNEVYLFDDNDKFSYWLCFKGGVEAFIFRCGSNGGFYLYVHEIDKFSRKNPGKTTDLFAVIDEIDDYRSSYLTALELSRKYLLLI